MNHMEIQSVKSFLTFLKGGKIIATMRLDEIHEPPLVTIDTSTLSPRVKGFVLERHLTVLTNFSKVVLPAFPVSEYVLRTTASDRAFAETIQQKLGFKVELNCAADAIVLPPRMLDQPFEQHDPAVMEYCLRQCRSLLHRDDDDLPPWTARVRDATLLQMSNDPGIGSIAAKLGVSERSLRRRLAEEGTSFRQILVDARLAIGHELLKTAGLDVSTAAWRTGYSEPSSFVRAFTKKFGYSPGSVKQEFNRQRRSTRMPAGGNLR